MCFSVRNSDGQIDFDEFRAMDKAFPLLFFPAFRMQDSLQAKFLGEPESKETHTPLLRHMCEDTYYVV